MFNRSNGGPSRDRPRQANRFIPLAPHLIPEAQRSFEAALPIIERWAPLACKYARGVHDRADKRQTFLLRAWQCWCQSIRRGISPGPIASLIGYRAAKYTICLRELRGGLTGRRLPGSPRQKPQRDRYDRPSERIAARGHQLDLPAPTVRALVAPESIGPELVGADPANVVMIRLDLSDLLCGLTALALRILQLSAEGRSRSEVAKLLRTSESYCRRTCRALLAHWKAYIESV